MTTTNLSFLENTINSSYFFLVILITLSLYILYICKDKNAGDILAFNSILGIISLFMIGILANNTEIWSLIVQFLGVVATGSAIASIFTPR